MTNQSLPILDNGFIDTGSSVQHRATGNGMLDGMRFAVKDVMAVRGSITGMGHPLWAKTHPPATQHADPVARCLAAGAELVGKTHTDELTYSLAGQNSHYGIPPNPAVPDGSCGGSSSGSASVVAAGEVPMALGTDTGGSVRIPASYCGLFGFRPTHGAVDSTGVAELAHSYDTVGWFTVDAELLQRVGDVLLPADSVELSAKPDLHPLHEVSKAVPDALYRQFRYWFDVRGLPIEPEQQIGSLTDLFDVFRQRQAWEAWQYFKHWIEACQPTFGDGVRERFANAALLDQAAGDAALQALEHHRAELRRQIGHSVWVLPTAPTAAPSRHASAETIEDIRSRTLPMTAIAGVGGLPQVTLPLLRDPRGPVGLSLIGPAGSDRALLRLAVEFAASGSTAK